MSGGGGLSYNKVAAWNKTIDVTCSIMEYSEDHKSNSGLHARQERHTFAAPLGVGGKRGGFFPSPFSLLCFNFPGGNKSTCTVLYWKKGRDVAQHSHWAKEMVDSVTSNHFWSVLLPKDPGPRKLGSSPHQNSVTFHGLSYRPWNSRRRRK
jgi:hypothetical protein